MGSWLSLCGIASGILALVAALAYVHSIIRGETKPDRGAYIIWALTSTISFFAYWAQGAKDSIWFVAGDFVVGIVMLALAIKFGYRWKLRRHTLAFIAVAVGLVLWSLTDEPFLALLCSVAVDAVGAVLIAIKAREAPYTENLTSWLIYLLASVLALVAVGGWKLDLLFYPAYAFVSTAAIVVAIAWARASMPRPPAKLSKPTSIAGRVP
jgi:hypothetical protein